jgi:hypothetical protein
MSMVQVESFGQLAPWLRSLSAVEILIYSLVGENLRRLQKHCSQKYWVAGFALEFAGVV